MRGRRTRPWVACAAGYLLTAVVMTFPAVLCLRTRAIGDHQDVWAMLWSNWWFVEALTHYHTNPFSCHLVWYPFGMDMHLLEIRLVPALLFLLAEPIVGLLAAYNLTMIVGIAASGMGMHVLAYHLTRDQVAAFIAGLFFCASPYMVGTVASGWVHLAHAEWLPLYVWAVLRMNEKPTSRRGAVAGALLCAAANTSWYYGIYLVIFSLIFGGYKLATSRRDVLRPRFVKAVAALSVVFLCGTLPVALPTMLKMARGGIIPQLTIPDIPAALLDYFVPSRAEMCRRSPAFGYSCSYIGYVTLAIAALGAVQAREPRQRRALWLWLAAISLILGLGPYLNVFSGRQVELHGHAIPLPDLLVRKALPFYRFCRNQWRHQCMLSLALSVLTAFGAAYLLARLKSSSRVVWPGRCALPMLFFMEAVWVSPVPIPVPLLDASVPKVYAPLVEKPDNRAIIVAPLDYKALYYQTYHRHPMVGYTSRKKRLSRMEEYRTRELFGAAERILDARHGDRDPRVGTAAERLRKAKVGYIIQHKAEGDRLICVR